MRRIRFGGLPWPTMMKTTRVLLWANLLGVSVQLDQDMLMGIVSGTYVMMTQRAWEGQDRQRPRTVGRMGRVKAVMGIARAQGLRAMDMDTGIGACTCTYTLLEIVEWAWKARY
jgi:hypothetical protein